MMATARVTVRALPYEDPHYTFGVHAGYRDIPQTSWGFKMFRTQGERDSNFDMQRLAYRHGLAPNIKGKFSETPFGGDRIFGFLTESVPFTEQERFYGRRHITSFNVKDYNTWWASNKTIVHELNGLLQQIGLTSKDNYNWANVGMLRGRLVCIDFSLEERIN